MSTCDWDCTFSGSIPSFYDDNLGPEIFEPYATNLIAKIHSSSPMNVLEIGCGTGRCTRHLICHVGDGSCVTATDVSPDMLSFAQTRVKPHNNIQLTWKVADACQLPFDDSRFDLVLSQFTFMFCEDRQKAFMEAARVLRSNGHFLFNVWSHIEENPLQCITDKILNELFPIEKPNFFQIPFSMHSKDDVLRYLHNAGLTSITHEDVRIDAKWSSPHAAAEGLILGSPLAADLRDRQVEVKEVVDRIAAALGEYTEDGGEVSVPMKATVYSAFK